MQKWIATAYPGVRYREHATRKLKNRRPDRYFVVRYRVGGKQTEEGVGWASEEWTAEKAHGLLVRLKEAQKTGEGPRCLADLVRLNVAKAEEEAREGGYITLGEFFDQYYLPIVQKRKRTWSHDKGRFDKGIRPALGSYPLAGITKEHMELLLSSIRDGGASEATALQYMAIMRQVYNLARVTLIHAAPAFTGALSPLDGMRLPRASMERERFLSYAEADDLLAAALSREDGADVHDLTLLGLNTGLRFSELLRLTWEDVSLVHGICSLRHEDMRKPGGRIPLNKVALAVLSRRHGLRRRGERHVFDPEAAGKDGCVYRRMFAELVEDCGLNRESSSARDRVVFHSLRHTFASWLAMSGRADIYRIKTLMRHKTIKMTERYAHLIPDATRDAVEHLRPECAPESILDVPSD